jgi:SAM-dependent methyltransferase
MEHRYKRGRASGASAAAVAVPGSPMARASFRASGAVQRVRLCCSKACSIPLKQGLSSGQQDGGSGPEVVCVSGRVESIDWENLPWEPHHLWRRYCDRLHLSWLEQAPLSGDLGSVCKTDLYDESLTPGLFPWLALRYGRVCGIDISASVVKSARANCPGLDARQSDIRCMPFLDCSCDLVVSNSSLDHFESPAEITVALREIRRILRPGGSLAITLDNPANPVVALRNLLPPWQWIRRCGLSPYYAANTLSKAELVRQLRSLGFVVLQERYLMHLFRALGVHLCSRIPTAWQSRWVSWLFSFEALEALPTRALTGYFVAVVARRGD